MSFCVYPETFIERSDMFPRYCDLKDFVITLLVVDKLSYQMVCQYMRKNSRQFFKRSKIFHIFYYHLYLRKGDWHRWNSSRRENWTELLVCPFLPFLGTVASLVTSASLGVKSLNTVLWVTVAFAAGKINLSFKN